jgi:hypothetical protein
MRIKFLKDHLTNEVNDEVEMTDGVAEYLIRMQVAEKVTAQPTEKKRIGRPPGKKIIEKP